MISFRRENIPNVLCHNIIGLGIFNEIDQFQKYIP